MSCAAKSGVARAPDRALWRRGESAGAALPADFYRRNVVSVARDLLGMVLVSTVDGELATGVIVETEAYLGRDDPASHASVLKGRTKRNQAMFGPAGQSYVYRSYGIHWCLNVVTGNEGQPQAVLLRALDPLEGLEAMQRRRRRSDALTTGPGRLCQALGVTDALYSHDLRKPPLRLCEGWRLPNACVAVSGRVGVSVAAEWPLRYFVVGNPCVSRGTHSRANARLPSPGPPKVDEHVLERADSLGG